MDDGTNRYKQGASGFVYVVVVYAFVFMTMLFFVALPGCGTLQCTEEGCEPTLVVNFLGGRSLEDGRWSVTVLADDDQIGRCEIGIPSPRSANGDCTGELGLRATIDGMSLERSTSRSPKLERAPSELEIVIERNSMTVLREVVEPSFDEYRPNGKRCPPKCRQATTEVTISQ